MNEKDFRSIGKLVAIALVGILCIAGLIWVGKAIIVNGVIMGVLTIAGLAILWIKSNHLSHNGHYEKACPGWLSTVGI